MFIRPSKGAAAVGNSPLNLDESPTGLGATLSSFEAISRALLFQKFANVSDHVTSRGTHDYGMFDVNFESNLVHTLRCVVVIAPPVVACSPGNV